jgi:hypothetical protein
VGVGVGRKGGRRLVCSLSPNGEREPTEFVDPKIEPIRR